MRISDRDIETARAKLVDVVGHYVELDRTNENEFKGLCPFHSESTASFTVAPGKGFYHCFGCGAHGDAIDFVKDYAGLTFHEAVRNILGSEFTSADGAQTMRASPAKQPAADEWQPMVPVPDDAPPPPNTWWTKIKGEWTELTSVRRWGYFTAEGRLIGYVARFELPGGGKDIIPQIYCRSSVTNEIDWRWRSFAKPRPIYGLEELKRHPTTQVIIVEGEKACDAAREREDLKAFVIVSWPGGAKAVKHVDWSPLEGRRVGLWPDADLKVYVDRHPKAGELMPFSEQPGTVAMLDIYSRIIEDVVSAKIVIPPKGMPDGWDLADEPPSPEWNALEHLKENIVDPATITTIEPIEDPTIEVEDSAPSVPPHDDPTLTLDTSEHDPKNFDSHFTILGHDHDKYYFFQHEQQQVKVYSRDGFTEAGLIALAALDWWEGEWPSDKAGIDRKRAINWLVRKAHRRGIYNPSRIRGRGAWLDAGRVIFHFGSHLLVDGVKHAISKVTSHFVYELDRSLPDLYDFDMSDDDGKNLVHISTMFRWSKPASAALLTGWIALAPICGSLKWRPHVWITGGAGCGKSTVVNDFVHKLMNGMDIFAQGNSTEAGIRQVLKSDALPVLFDEAEQNNEREQSRIQGVLALIRQSSTESSAQTLKGTAGGDAIYFHVRSMFCLSSIQVGMRHQADWERLTVLSLKPKRDEPGSLDLWEKLSAKLDAIGKDETIGARLVKRSIDLLPTTRQNIRIFSKAAAEKFGNQRDGDQYGTLLAGTWSLTSREVATPAQARALLDTFDWTDYMENSEVEESYRALIALVESHIHVNGGVILTVSELIRLSLGIKVFGSEMNPQNADSWLQRYGMRIKGKKLLLSNTSHELKKLIADTPYAADLRGQLLRVEGADRYDNKPEKFNSINSKCISIPLLRIISQEDIPLVDF